MTTVISSFAEVHRAKLAPASGSDHMSIPSISLQLVSLQLAHAEKLALRIQRLMLLAQGFTQLLKRFDIPPQELRRLLQKLMRRATANTTSYSRYWAFSRCLSSWFTTPSPAVFVCAILAYALLTSGFYIYRKGDKYQDLFLIASVCWSACFGWAKGMDTQDILLTIAPWYLLGSLGVSSSVHHAVYPRWQFDSA